MSAAPTGLQLDDSDIYIAVAAWISDSAATEETYGHVCDWDVHKVTNMDSLFQSTLFNEDISR